MEEINMVLDFFIICQHLQEVKTTNYVLGQKSEWPGGRRDDTTTAKIPSNPDPMSTPPGTK